MLKGKQAVLNAIQRLRDAKYEPRAYSGRGMYGAECVAVTLDTRGSGPAQKAAGSKPKADSLGRTGVVLYWPALPWPAEDDAEVTP